MVQPMNLRPCAFWTGQENSLPRPVEGERPRRDGARPLPPGTLRLRARTAPSRAMRLRRIKALLAIAVLVWAGGAASVRVWRGAPRPATPPTVVMTVRPGDTLWSLARRYGDPAAYMLDRVDALARANRLPHGAALVPGQKLRVPVQNPVEAAGLRQVASGTAGHTAGQRQ